MDDVLCNTWVEFFIGYSVRVRFCMQKAHPTADPLIMKRKMNSGRLLFLFLFAQLVSIIQSALYTVLRCCKCYNVLFLISYRP
jgi:hypothetical protein